MNHTAGKHFCFGSFVFFAALGLCACKERLPDRYVVIRTAPRISPDYDAIMIPPNIAPLNFMIKEPGEKFIAEAECGSENGFRAKVESNKVFFDQKRWERLLQACVGKDIRVQVYALESSGWIRYAPIALHVAKEAIDDSLTYRLIYPLYSTWSRMSIMRRQLGNFRETALFDNLSTENACVNCHAFNSRNGNDMLLHIRGENGGTVIFHENRLRKKNLKAPGMKKGAVYPSWHPSGKIIAFSSNDILQKFHVEGEKYIEVYDLGSSLVFYDVEKDKMFSDPVFYSKDNIFRTYPSWSPDGKYLYYTQTETFRKDGNVDDITRPAYNLMRRAFDLATKTFGPPETVFNASAINKSAALPRISPDGRWLLFTMADYGNFFIWHKEADIYLMDLATRKVEKPPINSAEAESYHSWSSNGRWIVFSSRRKDGVFTRPYFSYFSSRGEASKPFILPQEDPGFYDGFFKSYNIPEFTSGDFPLSAARLSNFNKHKAEETPALEIR
ncbi:MAG: hypothetical protein NTX59_08010 [Elusimicrobia bacterium]|nr:hypothetical protein [Elusimicrobiota bacterium]